MKTGKEASDERESPVPQAFATKRPQTKKQKQKKIAIPLPRMRDEALEARVAEAMQGFAVPGASLRRRGADGHRRGNRAADAARACARRTGCIYPTGAVRNPAGDGL